MSTTVSRARLIVACLAAALVMGRAAAQVIPLPPTDTLGISMEGYPYPFPVQFLDLVNDGQDVRMAYMDVAPTGQANGKTIFLLHGKNFFGAYWREPIQKLTAAGYRVIVPDQIGFGKSSKPALNYSFDLLASNTLAIADKLKIEKFAVLGHSMGGMLAVRMARAYPNRVARLILENPIGLEDYQQWVPSATTESRYRSELKQTSEAFGKYVAGYYVKKNNDWIEPFIKIKEAISKSAEYPRWAMSAALTTQMILQQPTVYDLPHITAPALLIIGQEDRTAVGKAQASPEDQKKLGNYPELGRRTAKALKNAKLVEIPNVGHIPHFEAPTAFYNALLPFLEEWKE